MAVVMNKKQDGVVKAMQLNSFIILVDGFA